MEGENDVIQLQSQKKSKNLFLKKKTYVSIFSTVLMIKHIMKSTCDLENTEPSKKHYLKQRLLQFIVKYTLAFVSLCKRERL